MYFRLRHQVFPVCTGCAVVLEPEAPVTVDACRMYELAIHPFSGLRRYGVKQQPGPEAEAFFGRRQPLKAEDGVLKLEAAFPQEDCYICRLYLDGRETEAFELYALEEDLFAMTPYRGDHHMHTWHSDGKDSPVYMAAAACRLGCDYCVITDHKQYEPSLIARDFYQDTPVDFLVIPGEEVHSPDNPVHILSVGGRESVNDWWRGREAEYRAAVDEELNRIGDVMGESDRYAAAASQVIFDRIRSVDGVSVLCHPGWIIDNGFNETQDVTDYLFDHRRFDALELIAGGAFEVGTQLQVSYYQERPKMPVLGDSDAHACFGGRLEPGNYTLTFARGLDAESIKEAIRAGRTVAGCQNRLYGDYRLVKYAYFLLRCYYPAHDEQRFRLGAQMLRMASSGGQAPQAREKLASPRPSENFAAFRCR